MKVHYELSKLNIKTPVVTLGSFDGVHKGHRVVLQTLVEEAHRVGGESVIITFNPHPRTVLYPNEPSPKILSTIDEKIVLLSSLGIDHLILLPFTIELANYSYQRFVKEVLVDILHVHTLIVGYDHQFGHNRQGDYEHLKTLSLTLGFNLLKEHVYEENQVNISSTKIRNLIEEGRMAEANEFLGYNYEVSGVVVHGEQLGRKIGFPTANVVCECAQKLLPKNGVYAVSVWVDDCQYSGMLNIGYRPTIANQSNLSVEVHIFDFNADIYMKRIRIAFIDYCRPEQKYANLNDLRKQLEEDEENIKRRIARLSC